MDKLLEQIHNKCSEVKTSLAKNETSNVDVQLSEIYSMLETLEQQPQDVISGHKDMMMKIKRDLDVITQCLSSLKALSTNAYKTLTHRDLTYEKN